MNSDELKELILKVISSWQVILMTIALILYVALVNYVGSARHTIKIPDLPIPKIPQKLKHEQPKPEQEKESSGEEENEEEEAGSKDKKGKKGKK